MLRTMKKLLCVFCVCALLFSCAEAAGYPKKKINAVIPWGAGGGTDTVMRPLCTLAQDKLGVKIVLRNMTGGTGSIGAAYVLDGASDGYTLLLGAENPVLYRALNIADFTYDEFECVLLIGDETVGIAVNKNAPFDSIEELIAFALENPGALTCATTGVGGLPWQVCALLTRITGAEFNRIPYDSDATARTAVISGECVFTACKIQSGLEAWKSGDLNYLCLLSAEEDPVMSGVSPITLTYPEFEAFLPWGPFYGVYVKKGTDAAIVEALEAAFVCAFNDASYGEVLSNLHVNPLGLTGEAAREYINHWSACTLEALECENE